MRKTILALISFALVTTAEAQMTTDCDGCPEMVDLPTGAAMSATPVTLDQFRLFADETSFPEQEDCIIRIATKFKKTEGMSWLNPGFAQDGAHPVVCITWRDATGYADWLSSRTGKFYRLPTVEEYAEATIAGGTTMFWWGETWEDVCQFANAADVNYREAFPEDPRTMVACDDGYAYTSPVKSYPPNAWGLYDMSGNVWQWTNSCLHGDCSNAIFRGGAWTVPNYKHFRIQGQFADRVLLKNSAVGFRVLRDAE